MGLLCECKMDLDFGVVLECMMVLDFQGCFGMQDGSRFLRIVLECKIIKDFWELF